MEVFEAIKERRSVRSYKNKDVSKEKIEKLIKAAIWAPSGSNIHAWEIKAVKGEKKDDIKRFSPGMIGDAPIVLVLCTDLKKSFEKGGKLAKEKMSLMDVSIAAQNICLQATSMGLGTCYIGSFNEKAVKEILDLPEDIKPELILTVGYPEKIPNAPARRKPEDAVEWVGWNDE